MYVPDVWFCCCLYLKGGQHFPVLQARNKEFKSNSANSKNGERGAAADELFMRNLPSSEWSEMQTEITSADKMGILDVKL